jgi:hypothetical protein
MLIFLVDYNNNNSNNNDDDDDDVGYNNKIIKLIVDLM